MKINRKRYLDKVQACWTGKNIGGTMGTPYEGKKEMHNISGFNSPKGEPLANDDLDLQLVWLRAIEDRGIRQVTASVLAEYWINSIPPYWNEYGICKMNMKSGMLPPYSGEYHNGKWKNSNGAWIRTEIWACIFPGIPDLAVEYAYRDACVDHGHGEGTYAAMFVAAMESMAFYESDIRKLIDKGLSFIPEDCKTAKSIKLAISLYDGGTDFVTARNAIVKENEDLGWFQAPANVSYVILGLLYGEGDYKKSMIHAINCGDDTDCTGATIGSLMGIIGGMDCVPKDWADYIGDRIISIAIDTSSWDFVKSCSELTRHVYELVPSSLKAYNIYVEYTDGEEDYNGISSLPDMRNADLLRAHTGLSQELPDLIWAKGRVEFDKCEVKPGDTINLKFIMQSTMPDFKEVYVKLILPEGWTADKDEINISLTEWCKRWFSLPSFEGSIKVTVGEKTEIDNKIQILLSSPTRPTVGMAKLVIRQA